MASIGFDSKQVYMTAGFSMEPLLHNGDKVYLEPAQPGIFAVGDLLAYVDPSGMPVVHRVISLSPLQTQGDNNPQVDAVDLATVPLAQVVRVERGNQPVICPGGLAGMRQFHQHQRRRRRRQALLSLAHTVCRLLPVKVRAESLQAVDFGGTAVYYWHDRAIGTFWRERWHCLWLPGAFFIKIPRRNRAPGLWPLIGAIGGEGVSPANQPGRAQALFHSWSLAQQQQQVCERARAAGMSALLYYTLANLLPQPYLDCFKADYYAQLAWNLRCKRTMDELSKQFTAWGVPFIALKGAFFCEKIYPSPATRFRRDIDLLIRREDAALVFERLQAAGWIPRERDMRRCRSLFYRHHLPSLYRENEPELELHWHIFKDVSLAPEAFWQYARPTGEGTQYDLAPEVHYLLLAYNLYYDSWELAERSLLDMALLQKKYPLDRELLNKLNHDFGLELDLGLPYAVFPEFFTAGVPLFESHPPAAARAAIRALATQSFARQVNPFLAGEDHAPKPTAAARFRSLGQWLKNLPGYLHKTPAKRNRAKWRLCRVLDRELPRYRALHQAARRSHGQF